MSYVFYKREFNSKAAYRRQGTHITLIVPAPVSAILIPSFQVSKNNFRGRVIKDIFLSRHFALFACLIFIRRHTNVTPRMIRQAAVNQMSTKNSHRLKVQK